jgi:hypothetical protein
MLVFSRLSCSGLDLLTQEEETHLKRCFSCKKGTLMTVVLFDKRGPPKNWKTKYQQAVKSSK